MSLLKNIFIKGVMDKDTNKALIKTGVYRHAENLRFYTNDGDDGIGNNIKGSLMVSDATDGVDYKCVFGIFSEDNDNIYFGLASDTTQSKIVEFNITTGNTTVVLDGDFNLNKNGYITGVSEIDGFLFWAEWGANPRRINIERAKNYGYNGFTEDDITVIVYPPLQKLRITLEKTNTESQEENNIEEKFISFSYRYRYLDGEYSVLAPYTNFAFFPKKFKYDFSEQSNRSMINTYNQVKIEFNTGSERVTEIQLVFKESESNAVWIIDDFNKSLLGYGNNEIKSFDFNNLKSKRALPPHINRSFFDNVPKTAKSQTIIDGRLIYGNYKENYNLLDYSGNKFNLDYVLNLISIDNTESYEVKDDEGNTITKYRPSLIPVKSIKSNRDYEVKIAYIFDYGRMTTLLSSKTNTIYIPTINSIKKNIIEFVMPKNLKAPIGAKYFRLFVKQNKKGYDYILPTLFYEDKNYIWFKIEGFDIDKVKKGDYLIVKIDSLGVIDRVVKVKVLEVKHQDRDFLNNGEFEGNYIKINGDKVSFNENFLEQYYLKTFHNSREKYDDPVIYDNNYTGDAHYYGEGNLNDLSTTSRNNTYNGADFIRFKIKISSTGTPDKFDYYIDNTLIQSDIDITGIEQTLQYDVKIKFENTTGHLTSDVWEFSVRDKVNDEDYRAYGYFRFRGGKYDTMTSTGDSKDDEIIENGANIFIEYDSYGKHPEKWSISNLSSARYDNIEEWYEKENIKQEILNQIPDFFDIGQANIYFVRGILKKDHDGNALFIQFSEDGYMTMVIKSKPPHTFINDNEADPIKVHATSKITQGDGSLLAMFETEPKDQPKEIFHEIGKTYKVVNGFHTTETDSLFETNIPTNTNDTSQTATQDLKIRLDWFNVWSYGNAVESYKIKDDFNAHYLDNGVRVLSSIREEYKEIHRIADLTWSDVYNDESDFNGLNTFNLSLINFIKLDKEEGSIQKLHNYNRNLLVYQEDGIGILPYNKNIIYDTEGSKIVGISTNILNKNSYRPYANGIHGISKNPESFVAVGSRKYSTDRVRGDLLRLANDGVTEINMFLFEHWFSNEMHKNKGHFLVGGYDPKHKEYLLHLPKTGVVLSFKESSKGFPTFYTYNPDLFLDANNELYAWKDGVMYRMNTTERRNNFFGKDYKSRLKFFVNTEFGIEKVFKALGLESSHAWFVKLKTNLTSRFIHSNSFSKKEDFWYSEIMGNTNDNINANSVFGLGNYEIVSGVINLTSNINTISVGDKVFSADGTVLPLLIIDIQGGKITLASSTSYPHKNLMYSKNQNIDGSSIRGDILEIDMECDTNDKLEIRAIRTEVSKSNYS